jgi:IS1 family transposase
MSTTGLKKTKLPVENSYENVEIDEMYWYVFHKPRTQTRENVYLIIMASRIPRQIVGFDIAYDKSPERIQHLVDNAPPSEKYFTDGYLGYVDVVYPGKHIRNIRDKSDAYTVEGVNADLRHYIPLLARRSRCFARTIETLLSVVGVFVDAYNRFGAAKSSFRKTRPHGDIPFSVFDFL